MIKKISLIMFLIVIIGIAYIYYKYNFSNYCSFEAIKNYKNTITYWFYNYKWQFIIVFFIAYSLSSFFIIPLFYLILNIVAGFIFGITIGLILVSIVNFYTTIITFLSARFLFRTIIERNFTFAINKVNQQLNCNGILYVFFIRAFPIMPFVVSNSLMGLTRINLWVYLIISQVSILPELILTLYIGKKLDSIDSICDIMNIKSYTIIFSVLLIISLIYWYLNKIINKKTNNKIPLS